MARPLTKLGWLVFEKFPVRISASILRRVLGVGYISKVKERGRTHLAARLVVEKVLRKAPKVVGSDRVILVGGVARIGKSTFAHMVAKETGGRVVNFDRLRRYYRNCAVGRLKLKHSIIDELCKRGRGLVIEGDELITDERIDLSENPKDFSVTAAIIKEKVERWGAYGCILGVAEDGQMERLEGLYNSAKFKDCWAVSTLSSLELRTLSRVLISHSKALRDESEQLDIPYFEIRTKTFEESVRHAATQVASVAVRGNSNGSRWLPN